MVEADMATSSRAAVPDPAGAAGILPPTAIADCAPRKSPQTILAVLRAPTRCWRALRDCEIILAADHIADSAAGLARDQRARCRVPRLQIEFPKRFESAAGGVAKVERRRPKPPHAVAAQGNGVIEVDVRVLVALVRGEPGRH